MRLPELITAMSASAPALVWALLHSLWQAALLAGLCRLLLLVVPARRASWRYGISLASLAAVVLLFPITWRVETHLTSQPPAPDLAWEPPTIAVSNPVVTASPSPLPISPIPKAPIARQATDAPETRPSWPVALASCWLAGVLLMVLRAGRVLHGETRIARRAGPVTDERVLTLLDDLRDRLRVIRRVALATVDTACSPAVVGIVSPVILIPASLLTASSPDHLRAILAHELAHIRRWDVLANLLQLLVESLLFHNPFVWFLSAQVRHEREACCDVLAARCCGGGPAYARVLVDVGQSVLASRAAVPFARPGGLADRVHRLLGLRPARDTWRLPPLSLAIGLIAGIASVFAVAQGTVKATDAVLSATKRNELIEQTVNRQREAAAMGTTRYVGTVATPDGGLLPRGTNLILRTTEPHSSAHASHAVDQKTGRFEVSATGLSAMLFIRAPGYTPWFEGPMEPGPEPVTDLGLLVLGPQIPLVVRVLDVQGEPVPDAEVTERCDPAPNASFLAGSATTDASGECTVPLIADHPVSLDVKAPGFEPAKFKELYPEQGQPLVLVLRPSIPLVLRVTDRASGKPIPGATVRELQHFVLNTGMSHQHDEAPTLAATGPDGACTLSGLHREGAYWLLVEAEGHGAELVPSATPGKKLEVQLGPPRILKGKITGDLSTLGGRRNRAQARVWHTIRMGNSPWNSTYAMVPIRIENGIGTFQVDTLYRGSFKVEARGIRKAVVVGEGETEVEFKITAKRPADLPSREVRLAFERQPGLPLPRGTMKVGHRDLSGGYSSSEDMPITDGVVSLRAPLGSSVTYQPDGVIGGWFAKGTEPIAPGKAPLTVSIPYVPAGAIAVSMVDGEGRPADGFMASVHEIEKSPYRKSGFLDIEGKSSAGSSDAIYTFTATPLPLGGTYEIVLYRGCTYVTTGPIRVTAERPLHKRRLVLEGGATITGQVVGPNGAPVSDATVSLGLHLADSSFATSDIRTDNEGRVVFAGVVPHPEANYTVQVKSERDFVPTNAVVEDLGQPVGITLKRGLVVTGRIINAADGSPVPADKVRLWRQGAGITMEPRLFYAERLTGQDGSFRFSNLAPGTYELHSSAARHDAKSPTVTAGQKEPVIWRVPTRR